MGFLPFLHSSHIIPYNLLRPFIPRVEIRWYRFIRWRLHISLRHWNQPDKPMIPPKKRLFTPVPMPSRETWFQLTPQLWTCHCHWLLRRTSLSRLAFSSSKESWCNPQRKMGEGRESCKLSAFLGWRKTRTSFSWPVDNTAFLLDLCHDKSITAVIFLATNPMPV